MTVKRSFVVVAGLCIAAAVVLFVRSQTNQNTLRANFTLKVGDTKQIDFLGGKLWLNFGEGQMLVSKKQMLIVKLRNDGPKPVKGLCQIVHATPKEAGKSSEAFVVLLAGEKWTGKIDLTKTNFAIAHAGKWVQGRGHLWVSEVYSSYFDLEPGKDTMIAQDTDLMPAGYVKEAVFNVHY